VQGIL